MGATLTIDLAGGAIAAPVTFAGGSLTVAHAAAASDWTVNGDGTGTGGRK